MARNFLLSQEATTAGYRAISISLLRFLFLESYLVSNELKVVHHLIMPSAHKIAANPARFFPCVEPFY